MNTIKIESAGRILIGISITIFAQAGGDVPKNESTTVTFTAYSKEEAIELLNKYISEVKPPF